MPLTWFPLRLLAKRLISFYAHVYNFLWSMKWSMPIIYPDHGVHAVEVACVDSELKSYSNHVTCFCLYYHCVV